MINRELVLVINRGKTPQGFSVLSTARGHTVVLPGKEGLNGVVSLSGKVGPPGPAGPAGDATGLPMGGVEGQVLKKASGSNYDAVWTSDIVSPILIDGGLL